MLKRIKPTLIGVVLLVTTHTVWAEQQFWVSVHSFERIQNAQRAVSGTAQQLAESFRVLGVDTSKGFYYRVASGPYLNRDIAEEQVKAAHAAGFEGAWLWVDDGDVFDRSLAAAADGGMTSGGDRVRAATVTDNYQSDFSATDASVTYSDIDYSSDTYDLPDYGDSYGTGSSDDEQDPDLLMQRQPPPELVSEAPPGYQLNKLHRNQ